MSYATAPDGALLRACSIPTCPATYSAATGPPDHEHTQERHWLRKSSPHLLLCPDHAHLWQGDHPHVPHLDHATRTCACACGHPLPGPTLGHMEAAWVDHARELLKES